jgi:hypothetical protein
MTFLLLHPATNSPHAPADVWNQLDAVICLILTLEQAEKVSSVMRFAKYAHSN